MTPPQHILVFKYPSRDRVKNLKLKYLEEGIIVVTGKKTRFFKLDIWQCKAHRNLNRIFVHCFFKAKAGNKPVVVFDFRCQGQRPKGCSFLKSILIFTVSGTIIPHGIDLLLYVDILDLRIIWNNNVLTFPLCLLVKSIVLYGLFIYY